MTGCKGKQCGIAIGRLCEKCDGLTTVVGSVAILAGGNIPCNGEIQWVIGGCWLLRCCEAYESNKFERTNSKHFWYCWGHRFLFIFPTSKNVQHGIRSHQKVLEQLKRLGVLANGTGRLAPKGLAPRCYIVS